MAAPARHRVMAASTARAAKKSAPKAAQLATKSRANAKVAGGAPGDTGRDGLQQQLAEAEARIVELEARLAGVTDRIAWIADRLHGLLHDEH
jgi:uncharacterized protein involved in exopolysaccharide biosynthesis